MNNSIIAEGKTTAEAIENGLKELKVSKDKVNVKVLENTEKRSFFSILAPRIVKVELTLKENRQAPIMEIQPEQIEQANKEHEELGKVLDGLDTLDNEAELDEISGNEDISEQDDAASQLDNNDEIEDETSEQFETINNPVYNEVENNGFSINDVNQAVDAKEAYEAEIRDMSQDEYRDQKELDQRVEENGS